MERQNILDHLEPIEVSFRDGFRSVFVHPSLFQNIENPLQVLNFEVLTDGKLVSNVGTQGFLYFVYWLYAGSIGDICNSGDSDQDFQLLCEVYRTGKAFDVAAYMDAIMDKLIDVLKADPCIDGDYVDEIGVDNVISEGAKTFAAGSPGRRLFVDFLVHKKYTLDSTDLWIQVDEAIARFEDEGFVRALVSALVEAKFNYRDNKMVQDWVVDRCTYHRHTELGLPCYNTQA